jgi:hypothetical protein
MVLTLRVELCFVDPLADRESRLIGSSPLNAGQTMDVGTGCSHGPDGNLSPRSPIFQRPWTKHSPTAGVEPATDAQRPLEINDKHIIPTTSSPALSQSHRCSSGTGGYSSRHRVPSQPRLCNILSSKHNRVRISHCEPQSGSWQPFGSMYFGLQYRISNAPDEA